MPPSSSESLYGRKRKQRIFFLGSSMVLLAASVALIAVALEDSITYFYTPTELLEKNVAAGESVRIGGMVVKGSINSDPDGTIRFLVTDFSNTISVAFKGITPDLFAEGQGVIAEGTLGAQGSLDAERILAKHDENYKPPEMQ